MPTLPVLDDKRTDAVREIANIGAGHAATVLSQLTSTPVMIDVPLVRLSSLGDVIPTLSGQDSTLAAVSMRMLGDLTGDTVFVLDAPAAKCLTSVLLQKPVEKMDLNDAMVRSGLQEVGNIMVSAFFNALASCLGLLLMPSVPKLHIGPPSTMRSEGVFSAVEEPVLVIQTAFVPRKPERPDCPLGGVLLFLPDQASLSAMLAALPRALRGGA